MFCVANSQKFAKYILLSLQCFDSVLSATTETAQRLEDDENEGSYGEDKHIKRYDNFRFTTTKLYMWENWTVPTRDPVDYGKRNPHQDFFMYAIVTTFLIAIVILFVFICIKSPPCKNCCSANSDSHPSLSSEAFSTVHRPPEITLVFEELHRPRTGRNQFPDSSRELFGEQGRTDLFSELDSNRDAADATGVAISFMNSSSASSSQGGKGTDITVGGKPPDYSTVVLGDLVNPTKPIFPVVKKDNETPPPEYSKENPFFK